MGNAIDDDAAATSPKDKWHQHPLFVTVVGGIVLAMFTLIISRAGSQPVGDSTTTTSDTRPKRVELAACQTPMTDGIRWVQIEGYQALPDTWWTMGAIDDDRVALCDGTALAASKNPRLMLARPMTAAEVASIDSPSPTQRLDEICTIRRDLRIAGGERPYPDPSLLALFSDFFLFPSDGIDPWIGPNRCWPILAGDEEFGSRAAIDRYFGVLSMVADSSITDLDQAKSLVSDVTTASFVDRAGGLDAILQSWAECDAVDVLWMQTPRRLNGIETVRVAARCTNGAGPPRRHDLAVTRAAGAPSWRVHWDVAAWGDAPVE